MSDRKNQTLFQQLTRLFKGSGPLVKRKIKSVNTQVVRADPTGVSSALMLSKTASGFNAALAGGGPYNFQERMARLQDYNEMDAYALVNAALDIYADEAVAQDANGRTLHIYSDKPAIKETLEELFYNTLNAEFNARPWTRNLCKYGDLYIFIDVHPEYGVINTAPIAVNELVREEGYDVNDPFAFRFRWTNLGNRVLENWEVAHFRLLGNDMFLPYGSSMIDGARRTWRQLVMIEDAMLVYRVTRAVDRRVFYVDVAGQTPDEIPNYMEQAKAQIRSQGVVNRDTGAMDMRYAPVSIEEDFWIPTRGQDTSTKIDTLPAGSNQAHVEDVEYIKKQLIAALKVPAAYLGYNDAIPGCFVGETTIPATNGKIYRIDQLAHMSSVGERLPNVYSYDIERNRIVQGRIVRAWETKRTPTLVRVTLKSSMTDSTQSFECTPDHRFLLTTGDYKRADQLTPDDKIESMYGRHHDGIHCKGYHQLFNRATGKWMYTHRAMADDKYGSVSDKEIVHHVDFNKLNNDPSNLMVVKDAKTHQLLHATYNRVYKRYNGSNNPNFNVNITFDELVEVASSCSNMNQVCSRLGCSPRIPQRLVKDQGMTWLEFVERYMPLNKNARNFQGKVTFEDVITRLKDADWKTTSLPSVAGDLGVTASCLYNLAKRNGFSGWKDLRNACSGRGNHVVLNVEEVILGEHVPVYDLEVEKHHNFAVGTQLDAAFVHNSSGLAQVDIRFSRTVNMIQRTVVSELNKIAMIHLFALGFRGDDLVNFEIRLSNPSTIAQQQKLDLMRLRFEIAGTAPMVGETSLLSERWMFKNIIGLTDQEILQVKRERLEDARAKGALEAAGAISGGGPGGEEAPEGGAGAEGLGNEKPPAPGGGPGLETAADDNRDQGDVISGLDEDDAPIKIAPALKNALYNRRRGQRRKTRFPTINDRAVSGATAVPSIPEVRQELRQAFEDLYPDHAESSVNYVGEATQSQVTVKPTLSIGDRSMLDKLAEKKGWAARSSTVNSNVLTEGVGHAGPSEERDDPREFELYDDEEDVTT